MALNRAFLLFFPSSNLGAAFISLRPRKGFFGVFGISKLLKTPRFSA